MNIFDLLDIIVKDHKTTARPVEWVESSGAPTKYVTTCPYCSQLLMFSPSDLYECNNSQSNVMCTECGIGAPKILECNMQLPTFVDPIADKLLSTDNYA
jgi:hypothetical protein